MIIREVVWAFHVSCRSQPLAAAVRAILIPLSSFSLVLLAFANKSILSASSNSFKQYAAAALGGALALGASSAFDRIQNNLHARMRAIGGQTIRLNLYRTVASTQRSDPLSAKKYAESVELVDRGAEDLAVVGWSIYSTVLQSVGVLASAILLASINPLAAVLSLTAFAPFISTQWTSRSRLEAEESASRLLRRERRMQEICVLPKGNFETRSNGSVELLSTRAEDLWSEAAVLRFRSEVVSTVVAAVGWAIFGSGFLVSLTVAMKGSDPIPDAIMVVTIAVRLRSQLAVVLGGLRESGAGLSSARAFTYVRSYGADAGEVATGSRSSELTVRGVERKRRSSGHSAPSLVVDQVSYRYEVGGKDSVSSISMVIPAGSVVAIVGPNGAGKSTLVNLLLGIVRPSSGSIRFVCESEPFLDVDPRRNSVVFQEFMKPPLLLWESIALSNLKNSSDYDLIRQVLDISEGAPIIGKLPGGLSATLSPRLTPVPLSHGEWQKIAIARGCFKEEADIFVLDEPASALDPRSEDLVIRNIVESARIDGHRTGRITVVVSHRLAAAKHFDQIVCMESGAVIESGTHEELLAKNGYFANFYRMQKEQYLEHPGSA